MRDEMIWNLGSRFVRLPFQDFDWDFRWWIEQFHPSTPITTTPKRTECWNVDAVGTELFADVFIEPVRDWYGSSWWWVA